MLDYQIAEELGQFRDINTEPFDVCLKHPMKQLEGMPHWSAVGLKLGEHSNSETLEPVATGPVRS